MTDNHAPRTKPGSRPARQPTPGATGYADRVEADRRRKDDAFRRASWSPVPESRRSSFHGLDYFAPDTAYRFVGVHLESMPGDESEPFLIDTSDDRPRAARRLGLLRFRLDGRDIAMTAYQVGESGPDPLFVPFRDQTSGQETYGAGRYLDIPREADGTYTVDFNVAYNPYCAYSDSYSCPLPPVENWLAARIEAGERLHPDHSEAG